MPKRQSPHDDTPLIYDDLGSEVEDFEQEAAVRAALGRIAQATSEVVIDLQTKGALYQYLRSRREIAIGALAELASTDPEDTATIIALQAAIRPYFDGCEFIRASVSAGMEADETIEELYGNAKTASPD